MVTKKSAILCLLLCLEFVRADIKIVFEKNETVSDDIYFENAKVHNSVLTAFTCNFSNSESVQKCKVFHTPVNNKSKPSFCNLVLDENLENVGWYPLTTNKAILLSVTKSISKKQYIKYTIIDFHDCKTTGTKLEFESYDAMVDNIVDNMNQILINDDATFDTLYNDAKVCGEKMCRITIDTQGNKVMGPVAFFVPLANASRFAQKIASSQSFVVTELKLIRDEAYRISLIKPDGQVIVLRQFKPYGHVRDHAVSTSQGLIRLCSKTNTTKVDCEIFNYSGKMMSKMNVDAKQKIETLAVHNLANNEFLLLTKVEMDTTVIKFGSNGSIFGVVNLPHFGCKQRHELESFVDVVNNEYCVTRVCVHFHNLRAIKECFGDNEFH